MELTRHGKTIDTDLAFRANWGRGVYFAVGRLDGGINLTASPWGYRKFQRDDLGWHAVAGPFDLMWRKGKL